MKNINSRIKTNKKGHDRRDSTIHLKNHAKTQRRKVAAKNLIVNPLFISTMDSRLKHATEGSACGAGMTYLNS
ncbi:hypothetical protein H8E88_25180 [candidate division KSB1 bacterium]|nr:hypothetical protein [candidate division KSB1 bacterium]MBL7094222.1 hypothetical protein [candidate division KSB1 bacterium]